MKTQLVVLLCSHFVARLGSAWKQLQNCKIPIRCVCFLLEFGQRWTSLSSKSLDMSEVAEEEVSKKRFRYGGPLVASLYFGCLPEVPKCPTFSEAAWAARVARPIFPLRGNILRTIKANRLSLIISQAGYGKTTQIPQYLLDIAEAFDQPVRIVCAVPLRIQAAAAARQVAAEWGEELGETVGYHSLLESHVSPSSTLLSYVTYEALLRALTISSTLLDTTNWIFLDELQEQDPFCELLLYYLAKTLVKFPALRVVAMSCTTVDRLRLLTHLRSMAETSFGVLSIPDGPAPQIEHIPPPPIPVDWNEEFTGMKRLHLEVDGQMSVNFEVLMCYLSFLHRRKPVWQSILVFLPDYDSLVAMKKMILYHPTRKLVRGSFVLFLLHSDTRTGSYEKMFPNNLLSKDAQHLRTTRRIILATDLTETCLGVWEAAIVIDSGKVRRQVADENGVRSLLGWISQSSADARASRAGKDGVCYRMYSKECYEAMDRFHAPGPRHLVMGKLVASASCLVRDVYKTLGRFLQPIGKQEIDAAFNSMTQIGVLDAHGELTKLGFMVMNFPTEPRLTRALICAVAFGCLDPISTLVGARSLGDCYLPTARPLNKERRARRKEEAHAGQGAFSDHLEIITAFKEWEAVFVKRYVPNEEDFLSAAVFQLVHGVRTGLVSQLRACGYIQYSGQGDLEYLNRNSNCWALVKAVLFTALYPRVVTADPTKDNLLPLLPESDLRAGVPVRTHWSSVVPTQAYFRQHRAACIMYDDLLTGPNADFLKACTVVSNLTVCLFAGQTEDEGPEPHVAPERQAAEDFFRDALKYLPGHDPNSDLLQELKCEIFEILEADDCHWLTEDSFTVLNMMRRSLKRLFRKKVEDPGCQYTREDEVVLTMTARLLGEEDKALGLTVPRDQKKFGSHNKLLTGVDVLGAPFAGFQNGRGGRREEE